MLFFKKKLERRKEGEVISLFKYVVFFGFVFFYSRHVKHPDCNVHQSTFCHMDIIFLQEADWNEFFVYIFLWGFCIIKMLKIMKR
ncbi:hypothetical protein F4703DRAFT_1154150 [Phycomyces blakesleeanus]